MSAFIYPVLGGLLIGASSVLLLFFLGRITGISGIFWGAVQPSANARVFNGDNLWRWVFLLGLPLGAFFAHDFLNIPNPATPQSDLYVLIPAGFLVGFGTKMGSGCTSGHGVCGIGRRSLRSFSATLVFMATGIITVFLMNAVGL